MSKTPQSAQRTPAWLGAVNDRAGLSALLDHGPLTRPRICELVGVSMPTASVMMGRLITAGAVEDLGPLTGTPGRNATLYAARIDRRLGVAVDLDAEELRATVVDAAGTERPVVRIALPRDAADRDAVAEIAGAIREASAAAGTDPLAVHTVVVGIPGYVDPGREGELFSETLPGWPQRHLREALQHGLDRRVLVENDVNLAAVAERAAGHGVEADVFALLWLGSGVGASFDVAGEIGFLPVSVEARELEPDATQIRHLVGARAVIGLARAYGAEAADYHAALAALADPALRDRFVDDLGERIAHAALPLLGTLDPSHVVLAGPAASLGGAPLAEAAERAIRRISRWYPSVVATGVARDPVLHGARVFLGGLVREDLLDSVAAVAAS